MTMDRDMQLAWLQMEVEVCAKKLSAHWAHRNKLFKLYDIDVLKKKDGLCFKFPHSNDYVCVGQGECAFMVLAQSGFPAMEARSYPHLQVTTHAVDTVALAMRRRNVNETP